MSHTRRSSSVVVGELAPQAMAHYREMRTEILDIPPIDRAMCELVITCQLALLGHEVPFKIHALRLREFNITKNQIQRALLAGLGITCVMCEVAQAIQWLDQAYETTNGEAA